MMLFSQETLNKLYRYGYSLTNNEADAYDLLQESLTRFMEDVDKQLDASEALPYLRRMMRNKFIDQLRRNKRFPLESLETLDAQVCDEDADLLEKVVIARQTLDIIWKAMMPLERELLHLWAVEGLNAREIAEQLDVPRGTILSRIHRVRKKIDQVMNQVSQKDDRGLSS